MEEASTLCTTMLCNTILFSLGYKRRRAILERHSNNEADTKKAIFSNIKYELESTNLVRIFNENRKVGSQHEEFYSFCLDFVYLARFVK